MATYKSPDKVDEKTDDTNESKKASKVVVTRHKDSTIIKKRIITPEDSKAKPSMPSSVFNKKTKKEKEHTSSVPRHGEAMPNFPLNEIVADTVTTGSTFSSSEHSDIPEIASLEDLAAAVLPTAVEPNSLPSKTVSIDILSVESMLAEIIDPSLADKSLSISPDVTQISQEQDEKALLDSKVDDVLAEILGEKKFNEQTTLPDKSKAIAQNKQDISETIIPTIHEQISSAHALEKEEQQKHLDDTVNSDTKILDSKDSPVTSQDVASELSTQKKSGFFKNLFAPKQPQREITSMQTMTNDASLVQNISGQQSTEQKGEPKENKHLFKSTAKLQEETAITQAELATIQNKITLPAIDQNQLEKAKIEAASPSSEQQNAQSMNESASVNADTITLENTIEQAALSEIGSANHLSSKRQKRLFKSNEHKQGKSLTPAYASLTQNPTAPTQDKAATTKYSKSTTPPSFAGAALLQESTITSDSPPATSDTTKLERKHYLKQKKEKQPLTSVDSSDVAQHATSVDAAKPVTSIKTKLIRALLIFTLVAIIIFASAMYYLSTLPPVIEQVSIGEQLNTDNTVTMSVSVSTPYLFSTTMWCALSDTTTPPPTTDPAWTIAENGICEFDVNAGSQYIFAIDSRGNISIPDNETVEINQVVSINIDKEKIFLPLSGQDTLNAELFILGEVDDTVTWVSSSPQVATVDNGKIKAVSEGETTITARTADGQSAVSSVVVTDLIKLPNYATLSKPMLYNNPYTDEQAHILDEILFAKVAQAGDGTRAGAVAAARFLALEFEYRIPYFFENGRLSPHNDRPECDGEGRFYHKGLFLCECKFDDLDPIKYGPATWGQQLLNFETKYAFVGGQRYPNGLDCSGFVTWALYNGGSDVGDMGAGDEYGDNDLCDLAEKIWLSDEFLQSDQIKVGDLIASDGHMAIIIGLEEDRIYIAESLFTSVRVTNFPRNYSVVRSGLYNYVIPMEDIYKGDGNLTKMWEKPVVEE